MKKTIAYLLCLVLALPAFGCAEDALCLAQADLPQTVQAPDAGSYLEDLSQEEYENALRDYETSYEAWAQQREQRLSALQDGQQDSLLCYWKNSMPVFLEDSDGKNHVYSPINTYLALGMLAEAAEGETRRQLLDALGTDDMELLRRQEQAIWTANYVDDGAVSCLLGASLWLSSKEEYDPDTIRRLSENCHASVYSGVMGSDSYNDLLRSWLNDQTKGLLKDAADAQHMDADTVMTLAATIYYKAAWSDPFSEARTDTGIFRGTEGNTEVSFMHRSDAQSYYTGEHFSALRKELAGSGAMWLILPDEDTAPLDLTRDSGLWELLTGQEQPSGVSETYLTVNESIPAFDVTCTLELKDGLRALGVTDVFDPGAADLSPILAGGSTGLYLSDAIHSARVKVDEDGVEAAAFTAMMVANCAMPPEEEVDFILDRPFLFVIVSDAGTPLFAGIVNQAGQ